MAERRPLDALLDLVVYAPVGFATSSRELMPELVAKGRQQVDSQVRLARMLGQFAVAYGKVEARKRFEAAVAPTSAPASPRPAATTRATAAPPTPVSPAEDARRPAPPRRRAPATPAEEVVAVRRHEHETAPHASVADDLAAAAPVPDVADLAIPGYDSLAASQVVARLEGLTTVELEQVRRYEQANRNRRTVLGKVAQLEGTRR